MMVPTEPSAFGFRANDQDIDTARFCREELNAVGLYPCAKKTFLPRCRSSQ
jgi:hypothetical protein